MWARLRNRLRFLFRRDRFEEELAEEMDFHRAMLEADKTRQGLGREAAAVSARRQMGDTMRAREYAREEKICGSGSSDVDFRGRASCRG